VYKIPTYLMPVVVYDNSWEFPETQSPGPVVMTVSMGTLTIKRIPLIVFGDGAWVNLQHSSLISALAMAGKQLWQPAKLRTGFHS
jgi:hypothetical protein